MLKIISSKNEGEIYTLARQEKAKVKINSSFIDCSSEEATQNAENISIFGDVDAYFIKIDRDGQLESLDKKFFEILESSSHFFVLVGSGVEFEKTLKESDQKFIKVEPKIVFDFPAELVSALQRHDKKNSWNLLLKELKTKDAEPIHGSCVFAYKSLLVYLNDPKKNSELSGVKEYSWKQAKTQALAGKREKVEVEDKYFNLILAYYSARSGEGNGDLATQLENWVLVN